MNLDDVPQGERIYIDANIFIYHFGGRSPECKAFLNGQYHYLTEA